MKIAMIMRKRREHRNSNNSNSTLFGASHKRHLSTKILIAFFSVKKGKKGKLLKFKKNTSVKAHKHSIPKNENYAKRIYVPYRRAHTLYHFLWGWDQIERATASEKWGTQKTADKKKIKKKKKLRKNLPNIMYIHTMSSFIEAASKFFFFVNGKKTTPTT